MKIKNIYQCGLDILHRSLMSDSRRVAMLGAKANMLLNHISISFELEDVNAIDMIQLKKMTKTIKIIKKGKMNPFNTKNDKDEYRVVHNMIELTKDINADGDISDPTLSSYLLPASATYYDVIAVFKGPNITSILGTIFQNVFTITNPNKPTEKVFLREFPSDKVLNNILSEFFFKSFYNYAANSLDSIDTVTDFMIHKEFYNYINTDEMIILSHINSPYGLIKLLDNTEENFYNQLLNIKKFLIKSIDNRENDDCEIFFTLKTSFETFIRLFIETDYVVDHQDIKILLGDKHVDVSQEIINKYANRATQRLNEMFDLRDKNLEISEKKLQRYMLIANGQSIVYTIKVPMNINELLEKEKPSIPKDTLELTRLHNEILGIYGSIDEILS